MGKKLKFPKKFSKELFEDGKDRFFGKENIKSERTDKIKEVLKPKIKNVSEKLKNINKNIEEKSIKKKLYENTLDKKSVINKIGIFNPRTYKYLSFAITFISICCIILLLLNKNIFYSSPIFTKTNEIDIKINSTIFYLYTSVIFLIILQLYILKENHSTMEFTIFFKIINGLNIILVIGLSYFIYKEIHNLNDTCPNPKIRICKAASYGQGLNDIEDCSEGPYECIDKDKRDLYCIYSDPDNPDPDECNKRIFNDNFNYIRRCVNYECPEGFEKIDEDQIENSGECGNDDDECNTMCCIQAPEPVPVPETETETETEQNNNTPDSDIFTQLFNDLSSKIESIQDRLKGLTPGEGIPGPVGPQGPPGERGPTGTPGNQGQTIIAGGQGEFKCDDGTPCSAGKCDDKGKCVENFTLISLQDKINLQNKYNKNNKANTLMNNLEKYLLNI